MARRRSEREKESHRQWLTNNADRVRETKRAWRKANADKIRAQKRARYRARLDEERAKDRARYAANPERKKASAKAWREANPERKRAATRAWRKRDKAKRAADAEKQLAAKREKKNAQRRARYAANPERARARSMAWHHAHREQALAKLKKRYANPSYLEKHRARETARYVAEPDKIKRRVKAWKKNHPEKVRAIGHRRRSRLIDSCSPGVLPAEWAALVERFAGRCAYCGTSGTTIDHIVPISKGGRDEIGNVLPACKSCNSSKNNKDLAVWLAEKGLADPRDRVSADHERVVPAEPRRSGEVDSRNTSTSLRLQRARLSGGRWSCRGG